VDVISLLAEGASDSQMAERLGIADVTVRRHVSTVLAKLQVAGSRRGGALAAARRACELLRVDDDAPPEMSWWVRQRRCRRAELVVRRRLRC